MILGHAHPDVIAAVTNRAADGLSFGAPTVIETVLARKVVELVPWIELLRMVSSGTEATMSAIRLARGFTGRDRIVKFEGCYHGHSDALLVKAGSGALTLGVPDSAGVPAAVAAPTTTLAYNDLRGLEECFAAIGGEIACVIVEPVAGNMNCVLPAAGFLQALRELCTRHGAVLIFDEVMTGFRVATGGAQALYGVQPDLTTLGKIIGGGMPVGAFGGRRDIMVQSLRSGPCTRPARCPAIRSQWLPDSRHSRRFPARFPRSTRGHDGRLVDGLEGAARSTGVAFTTNQVCGMFGLFFTSERAVSNYRQVMACDVGRFQRFFHAMLDAGVYLAPSPFEAGFVSAAHGDAEIEATIDAAGRVFASMARDR